jgi:Uncharacterised protein family (UPF0164)
LWNALVAITALTITGFADTSEAAPTGFAFLEIPAGARASALGGAYDAMGEGVESAFWNPAGLAATHGLQVTGSHYELFENLRSDQFAIAGRMLGGGIAASMRALYSEPIEERDEFGNLIGTFGADDLEFALGYGRDCGGGLRAGGSTQVLHERIANVAATTYAFGLGATWEPPLPGGLRFGASIHNWGADAQFTIDGEPGASVPLPVAFQTGASAAIPVGSQLQLRGSLEIRITRGRDAIQMVGAELTQSAGVALRVGFRANDDASSFSVGAGYSLSALRIDYAFVPYRLDLGDTHRLSFAAQF